MSSSPSHLSPATGGPVRHLDSAGRGWMVRLVAFGLMGSILLACAACGVLLYSIRPRINDDPAAVPAVVEAMIHFTPCAGFEPRGTIVWEIPFVMSLRGAYYEHRSADGMLMLIEVSGSGIQRFPDVRQHIENVLREKNGVSEALVVDPEVKRLTIEVQGRQREFVVSQARDSATDTPYKLLEGTVEGNGGPLLIGMRVAEAAWNLEAVEEMLRSMR